MACHRKFLFSDPVRDPKAAKPTPENGKLTPGKNPGTTALPGEVTRHGTPVGDPGPFTRLFFTPLTTAGFWGNHSPNGKSKAGVCTFYAGGCFPGWAVFFLFCQTGLCVAQTGPDRAGTGRSPTWGGNRHTGPPRGQTGGLRWFCGTALGRLCFDSSAVRSATRIGESCRPPVFRVTCVTGGKGSSVFCEGGRIPSANSRPQGRNVFESAVLKNTVSMGFALIITQDMELRMENDYGLAVLVSGATGPAVSQFLAVTSAYCAWPSPRCAGRCLRLSPTGRSRWPAQAALQPAVPGSSPRPGPPYSHGRLRSTARPP